MALNDADYESRHGEITQQEMTAAARRARERAVVCHV